MAGRCGKGISPLIFMEESENDGEIAAKSQVG